MTADTTFKEFVEEKGINFSRLDFRSPEYRNLVEAFNRAKLKLGIVTVSRRTLHVLVVDNDDLACAATTGVLQSLGYRADGERGSLRALRVFSEDPDKFDLAVIEPVMPDIMGLELAVRFRRIRPGFPVIFYGGYVDEPSARRIETGGFGPVIFKPLVSVELNRKIEHALRVSLRNTSLAAQYLLRSSLHQAIQEAGQSAQSTSIIFLPRVPTRSKPSEKATSAA